MAHSDDKSQSGSAATRAEVREVVAGRAAAQRKRREARTKEVPQTEGFAVEGGIKSRERVQDIAEVFTAPCEVNAMLDLVGDTASNPKTRFLEPACGNGNFLEEIVRRKLATVTATARKNDEFEFLILLSLSSTYGIDINSENVAQARLRLQALVVNAYSTAHSTWRPRDGFYEAVGYVLRSNIVLGDTLQSPDEIMMVEYTTPAPLKFAQRVFTLAGLEEQGRTGTPAKPLQMIGARYYWELAQ